MISKNELLSELDNFYGTEQYHRWNTLYPRFVLTDGANHLANRAGAYWLVDIVGSYQPDLIKRGEFFQVWTINVYEDHTAIVKCDDGNDHLILQQVIPYTDFPLDEYSFYAIWDGSLLVILLKSEY